VAPQCRSGVRWPGCSVAGGEAPKLEKLDNEIVSFAGDFWLDVRMFIALRLKQLDRARAAPRSLLKPKKNGTRGEVP